MMTDSKTEIRKYVLDLSRGSATIKTSAAQGLEVLAHYKENHDAMLEEGAIDAFVKAISECDTSVKLAATKALFRILLHSTHNRGLSIDRLQYIIESRNGISSIVNALSDTHVEIRSHSAGILSALLLNNPSCHRLLANIISVGAIRPLVKLLGVDHRFGVQYAAGALSNLALDDRNPDAIGEAGGINTLLSVISSSNHTARKNAFVALINLARHIRNSDAIREAGGIAIVINCLQDSRRDVQQSAGLRARIGPPSARCQLPLWSSRQF